MERFSYFLIFVAAYYFIGKIYRHWRINKAFTEYGTRAEYQEWRETGQGVDKILTRKFIAERDRRYR